MLIWEGLPWPRHGGVPLQAAEMGDPGAEGPADGSAELQSEEGWLRLTSKELRRRGCILIWSNDRGARKLSNTARAHTKWTG